MHIEPERLYHRVLQEDAEGRRMVERLFEHLPALAAEADRLGDVPPALWDLVDVGTINRMNMPVEYGGLPLTATALRRSVVFERVAEFCPGLPIGLPGPSLSTPPVLSLGTAEQKSAYFARFHRRDQPVWGAFAITEPSAGSDATAIRTVALADGDDYVLNGEKCFITSGGRAEMVVVFATVDRSKGRFGIRAFLIPRDTPGYRVERCEDMMGLRASQLATLSFTDVRVPKTAMLGHTGVRGPMIDAFTGAQSAWDYMRPALAAAFNGACRGMIAHTRTLLKAGDHTLSRHAAATLADDLDCFTARVDASRLLALRAAWRYDHSQKASLDASLAKAFASSLAMELAERLCQAFGVDGVTAGRRFEKFYRDAKAFDIIEGTGDMQRLMVARAYQAATA